MKKPLTVILVLVSLLIGWGIYWFLDNFERAERETTTAYSGEAILNDYLAAIRFLAETGHEVDYKSSLLSMGALPPATDILIVPTRRFDIGPERVHTMLDWVKSGGHLVIRAFRQNRNSNRIDYLLKELGVQVVRNKDADCCDTDNEALDKITGNKSDDSKGQEKPAVTNDKDKKDKTKKYAFMAKVTENGEPKEIVMNRFFHLKHNEDKYFSTWTISDGTGNTLIELGVGDGRITILNTMYLFTNKRIDKYDHASFLWHLVNPGNKRAKVWMILNDDMPPLYALLYKHARLAVFCFVALLVIWMAYAVRRFGPRIKPASRNRRELSEHIHAAGNFLCGKDVGNCWR